MEEEKTGLHKLSELKKFEVADEDFDIRKWKVFAGDNTEIGIVDDLVVDLSLMKVKFMNIKLLDNINQDQTSRLIVVPIKYAHIDKKKKSVFVSTIETRTILNLPDFEDDELSVYNESGENLMKKGPVNEDEESPLLHLSSFKNKEEIIKQYGLKNWDVFSSDGKKIGKIKDVILELSSKKIRYFDIEVEEGLFLQNKRIIIPFGLAALNYDEDCITIDIPEKNINKLPEYDGNVPNREFETNLRKSIRSGMPIVESQDDFYNDYFFFDQRFFRHRKK